MDIVKVNLEDALFSWEQKPGFGVVLARCLSKLHYSHVKREGNMVAFVLVLFVLIVEFDKKKMRVGKVIIKKD